jgi:hypothetical protein
MLLGQALSRAQRNGWPDPIVVDTNALYVDPVDVSITADTDAIAKAVAAQVDPAKYRALPGGGYIALEPPSAPDPAGEAQRAKRRAWRRARRAARKAARLATAESGTLTDPTPDRDR